MIDAAVPWAAPRMVAHTVLQAAGRRSQACVSNVTAPPAPGYLGAGVLRSGTTSRRLSSRTAKQWTALTEPRPSRESAASPRTFASRFGPINAEPLSTDNPTRRPQSNSAGLLASNRLYVLAETRYTMMQCRDRGTCLQGPPPGYAHQPCRQGEAGQSRANNQLVCGTLDASRLVAIRQVPGDGIGDPGPSPNGRDSLTRRFPLLNVAR